MTSCDCLNECGDDPWLRDGRAEWCDWAKAIHAERERKKIEYTGSIQVLSNIRKKKHANEQRYIDIAITLLQAEIKKLH